MLFRSEQLQGVGPEEEEAIRNFVDKKEEEEGWPSAEQVIREYVVSLQEKGRSRGGLSGFDLWDWYTHQCGPQSSKEYEKMFLRWRTLDGHCKAMRYARETAIQKVEETPELRVVLATEGVPFKKIKADWEKHMRKPSPRMVNEIGRAHV